jgi:hypothetical protein
LLFLSFLSFTLTLDAGTGIYGAPTPVYNENTAIDRGWEAVMQAYEAAFPPGVRRLSFRREKDHSVDNNLHQQSFSVTTVPRRQRDRTEIVSTDPALAILRGLEQLAAPASPASSSASGSAVSRRTTTTASTKTGNEIDLPLGYEVKTDAKGRQYYVDHVTKVRLASALQSPPL